MSPTPPSVRSVKIGSDERGGWTTDRPPREGDGPPRPVDVSARCRVLAPSDRLRYSPGSLLLVVSADPSESARFAERVVEERGAVLSLAKVRTLLAGRVAEEELEARAQELLDAAVVKRLGERQTIVLALENLDAAERERYVRLAHGLKRPRHLILLEAPREQVPEEQRATLNELRRALDSGDVGQEGFQTALRLGGNSIAELKRIVFQPPPRED
jgi:predicted kinase